VFQLNAKGLGYYLDNPPSTTKDTVAKPTPIKKTETSKSENTKVINKDDENTKHIRKEFPFDFRQTAKCLPIIIQVPDIASSTVSVTYGTRLVSVKFCTSVAKDTINTEDPKDRITEEWYGMSFELVGDLCVEECRYDVATSNMVLVLVKRPEGFWIQQDNIPVLRSKPYVDVTIDPSEKLRNSIDKNQSENNAESKMAIKEDVTVSKTLETVNSSFVDSNKKSTPINAPFSSHASGVLFELD